VARQIDSGLFERAVLDPPKLSTALRQLQPQAEQHFRDVYQLDFLALPDDHSEADLHRGLLQNLGRFLTELGRDFCYIGSQYPVQVGGQDFALDCSDPQIIPRHWRMRLDLRGRQAGRGRRYRDSAAI
jgi:predicted nuclease of restriction endonuclease-like (RecB) superfamily